MDAVYAFMIKLVEFCWNYEIRKYNINVIGRRVDKSNAIYENHKYLPLKNPVCVTIFSRIWINFQFLHSRKPFLKLVFHLIILFHCN